MTEAPSLPTPDPNSIPEQSQIQPQLGTPTGSPPPVDAPPAPISVPNDDNSEPPPPTETDGPVPEVESAAPSVGDSSGAGISSAAKEWVDKQRPNKKSGDAIINLAKNRNRKDIADIERYVDILVKAGTIPMSGKRPSTNDAKIDKPISPSTASNPFPGTKSEAVEVLISDLRKNAQIRVEKIDEENVQRIMEDFDPSDPIHVFDRPEGEKDIMDGHHRVEAATRLGRTSIQAIIHKGTLYDGLVFAYKVNAHHGKPLEKDDRKHALVMIKATPEGSKLTGEQLAEKLGVSRQTIHTYLAELNTVSQANKKQRRAQPDEVTTRNKAFATLMRLETNFGLTLFHDFVKSLDDDKRAELRAMLNDEAQ